MAPPTTTTDRAPGRPALRSAAIAAALGACFAAGCVNRWEQAYQGERLAPLPADAPIEMTETETLVLLSDDVPPGYRRLGGCDFTLGIECGKSDLRAFARSIGASKVHWRRSYLGSTERQVTRNVPVYDKVQTTGTITNADGSVSTIDSETKVSRWEQRTYVVRDTSWWHGAVLLAPTPVHSGQ